MPIDAIAIAMTFASVSSCPVVSVWQGGHSGPTNRLADAIKVEAEGWLPTHQSKCISAVYIRDDLEQILSNPSYYRYVVELYFERPVGEPIARVSGKCNSDEPQLCARTIIEKLKIALAAS